MSEHMPSSTDTQAAQQPAQTSELPVSAPPADLMALFLNAAKAAKAEQALAQQSPPSAAM